MLPYRLRSLAAPALCAGIAVAAALCPASASAASPFLVVPDPAAAEASPAYRYANMTDEEALAELDRRGILYVHAGPVSGVRAPVRLAGRLHGVYFHSSLPAEDRVTSVFEILDARLALALDDFAAVLERHDVDEVVHYTMYRPNVPPPAPAKPEPKATPAPAKPEPKATPAPAKPELVKGATAPADEKPRARERSPGAKQKKMISSKPPPKATPKATPKAAVRGARKKSGVSSPPARPAKGTAQARPAAAKSVAADRGAPPPDPSSATPQETPQKPRGTWAPPGTRHPAGLAIDVAALKRRDGTWISVAQHFDGRIGDRTCGEGVRVPDAPEARELRSIVCESVDLGIFTYVLTPNYNAAHADHYHMEIKPGVRWFLVH